MIRRFSWLLAFLLLGGGPASADDAMLSPPEVRYFSSKGSWKQEFADQWALQRIGFDSSPQSAWRLVRRDAQPVIVAVIDTGLDWDHRNFSWDSLWRNPAETQGNGIDDDKDGFVDDVIGWNFIQNNNRPWDHDGHGTLVAGIIAAAWSDKDGMAGVNPLARLMILKGIDDFGRARASKIAEAIIFASDHGARVINLSIGGNKITEVERAAVEHAFSKGAVIVAAAGNEGVDVSNYGIAASDKVLVVGATDFNDQHAPFSNWGKNISVAAPGVDVMSLRARRTDTMVSVPGGKYIAGSHFVGPDRRYYRASGTSFAAPLVTGLASLMIAKDPSLTNVQVMQIIKSTARDVGIPGVDQYTGYGIVDAGAALAAPKDYFLLAGISRLAPVQKGNATVVRVFGTADANAFKSARIEIGQGDNPQAWKPVGTIAKPVSSDGPLGDIAASALAGAKVWNVRLIVQHGNGAQREVRYKLNVG
ncbi:S8 family serine peptidase [Bradyrhizobium sp. INPA01-394B]|uniref:S8 family serine peptidase n=1 Tax=Bradyrhizobium campsiandrae TaxID=1729892 RepID=A0ABR7UHY0_9BRAD|nr:S8 family serine peptidase [Bradyrhizobium campsiandrae]MBC9879691.1 S8 family serine peptidase [Bradyrhizobium campsiandrae]MBC9983708.1 S8 family serine peptidase [Bradyrhizobium campsiandrae]